jgi:hypothetical protein
MDLSEFRRRLSTLGPDIHAWPDRDAAINLLARSDDAVALLAAGEAGPLSETETDAIVARARDPMPD